MKETDKTTAQGLRANNSQRGLADIQYEIWATFMRRTGDDLRNKEFRLIAQSAKLIDSFQNSKSLLKDQQCTDDSTSCKNTTITRESLTRSSSPDDRMLYRRSPRSPAKSICFLFSEQLREVQANCSQQTARAIKLLVKEYQRVNNSFLETQANEKRLYRKVEVLQRDHEHLAILKKLNQESQKNLAKIQIENQQLKTKNKKIIQKIDKLKQEVAKSAGTDAIGLLNLANFLTEKQRNINIKAKKVQDIEQNILEAVGAQLREDGCDKCCSFLRKIKESVVRLRRSLLEQSEQLEQIYTRYKSIFIPGQY